MALEDGMFVRADSPSRVATDLALLASLREGARAESPDPLGNRQIAFGVGLCARSSFAYGCSSSPANSVAHGISGRVRRDPRSLGLAAARLAVPPGGFIRDPRREASLRNTASSPRAGLAANPPNRSVAPCSARRSASRPAPQEASFLCCAADAGRKAGDAREPRLLVR